MQMNVRVVQTQHNAEGLESWNAKRDFLNEYQKRFMSPFRGLHFLKQEKKHRCKAITVTKVCFF